MAWRTWVIREPVRGRKHGRQVRAGLDRWTDYWLHTGLIGALHWSVEEIEECFMNPLTVVTCTLCVSSVLALFCMGCDLSRIFPGFHIRSVV